MKFIALSDVHATSVTPRNRKDDLMETFFRKFNFILDYGEKQRCDILQAGDMFHRPRDWKLLARMLQSIKRRRSELLTVYGQHDTYLYNVNIRSATCTGILEITNNVSLLTQEPFIYQDEEDRPIAVFGASWGEPVPKPAKDALNILVIHAPISDRALFPGHDFTQAEAFLKKHKFNWVICGDVHRKFKIEYDGRWLLNTGPLLRYEASEEMLKHKPCFFVIDTDFLAPKEVEIPHEPARDVLSRKEIEASKETQNVLDKFIKSIKKADLTEVDINENLNKFLDNNIIDREVRELISEVMSDV